MQARGNSQYGKKSYGNGGNGGGAKTFPTFTLKTKAEGAESYEDIGGAFKNQSKAGNTYYSVSKTPYRIFENDDGSLILKAKGDEDGRLSTVATLKEKMGKNGVFYVGEDESKTSFYLFPYARQA